MIMKRKYFAAATAILLLSGCGGTSTDRAADFETITVEKSVSAASEAGAPQCSVRLELAVAHGDSASSAQTINSILAHELFYIDGVSLQQAADSFARKYTSDYVANIVPLYREDSADELKRAWYEYHYNINSEVSSGREGVTVYKAVVDYYEGGAHGIQQQLFFNFDNHTGQRLTLSDIFVPGFEQQLSELLLAALIRQTGAQSADDLRNKGYLYAMDMFATENFRLADDGVTFVYNPYEIAPYSAGIIELSLSNDELKALWK